MRFFFILALALAAIMFGCARTCSNIPITSTAPVLRNRNVASPHIEQPGVEHVFTNTQIVMWMPSRAEYSDGDYHGYDFTRVMFNKIEIIIQIQHSGQEQESGSELNTLWAFQDHPSLAIRDWPTRDGQPRKQMRKTIWDPARNRKLFIEGTVLTSDIYADDIEAASKMIESIRLLKPQSYDKQP